MMVMLSPGRPRTFNREQALNNAMEIFWAQGYEGATLTELQRAMGGITAPSLYAAFGSKEELFREAVGLYSKIQTHRFLKALTDKSTARESVEAFLMAMAKSFSQPDRPRGCLVILGAINCMQRNRSVQDYLRHQRALRQKTILQRLQRGVAEGDLPKDLNLNVIASFYSTVMNGLAIQARDGATRRDLKTTVDCAMGAWDRLVK
jgi:AcrR family transcriptional regulator